MIDVGKVPRRFLISLAIFARKVDKPGGILGAKGGENMVKTASIAFFFGPSKNMPKELFLVKHGQTCFSLSKKMH